MKMYLFLVIWICGLNCFLMLECVPVICGERLISLHIYWNKNHKRIKEFPRFFIYCTFNTEPRLTCNSPVFKISSRQRNVQINRHASTEIQQNCFVNSHTYCIAQDLIVNESPWVRNLLYDNCNLWTCSKYNDKCLLNGHDIRIAMPDGCNVGCNICVDKHKK